MYMYTATANTLSVKVSNACFTFSVEERRKAQLAAKGSTMSSGILSKKSDTESGEEGDDDTVEEEEDKASPVRHNQVVVMSSRSLLTRRNVLTVLFIYMYTSQI